jgi:hypothetical protein
MIIWRGFGGSGHVLSDVISQIFSGETEENNEYTQANRCFGRDLKAALSEYKLRRLPLGQAAR